MKNQNNNSGAQRTIGAATNKTIANDSLRELCEVLNNRASATPKETAFLLSDEYTMAEKLELLGAMEKFARVVAVAMRAYINYLSFASSAREG